MAKVSREKFISFVKRSKLVTEDQLRAFLATLAERPKADQPKDAEALAHAMVEAKLLNDWHVKNLLNEKYTGFILGKYKLLGHLGTGGMSSVYLAEHPVMERLVAIKVLPRRFVEDQNYLDRFKREARAVAALDHPNIVRAHDIDQHDKRHFIVMEYVDGRDLQKMVKDDGPLPAVEAADYIAQAALGLQHAHDAGLVHRDVKPANCLVDTKGVLKLLDMGLAKFSEDDRPAISAIYDDSVVGTADYLAPEQAVNSQQVDYRADIYSLGCTFYFMLTGQPPFSEGTIAERLLKHQTQEPTPIFKLRPDAPRALVDLCRRMMVKDRDQRIQTAAAVAGELAPWLHQHGRSRVPLSIGVGSDSGSGSEGGFRRSGFGAIPPPPSPRRTPADTVSSSGSDTIKNLDSRNDNLTLAPLEDELPASEESDAPSEVDLDTEVTEDGGASSIEGIELDKITDQPVDELLKRGPRKSTPNLPSRPLVAPPPSVWESPWMLGGLVVGLIAAAILTLVVVLSMAG